MLQLDVHMENSGESYNSSDVNKSLQISLQI